jgi:hypothetical protein
MQMAGAAPFAALWYWLWHYLTYRGVPVHVDTGLFLVVASFAVVPVLVFRSERWRGVLTLGGLLILYLGANAVAAVVYYLVVALDFPA